MDNSTVEYPALLEGYHKIAVPRAHAASSIPSTSGKFHLTFNAKFFFPFVITKNVEHSITMTRGRSNITSTSMTSINTTRSFLEIYCIYGVRYNGTLHICCNVLGPFLLYICGKIKGILCSSRNFPESIL